jgi:flavodoxin
MSTTLYYFSGTGNSLSIARKLAASIDGARIVPIGNAQDDPNMPCADTIGFIFPTHAYG